MTDRPATSLVVLLLLTASLAAGGCSPTLGGDGRSLSQHNDELRETNLALSRQVEKSQQQIAGLESELRVYRQRAALGPDGSEAPEGVVVPVFAGMDLGRYSGPVDTDGDGLDDTLRLYIKPTDQKARTLPVAGRATVQLTEVGGGGPPISSERSWEPADWDAAYRSGFTGDHYTLDLPLSGQRDAVNIYAELVQAGTGVARGESAVYRVRR
ncbi:MAG: hypothetical protein AAF710_02995 [Planctomycetota bacterium]